MATRSDKDQPNQDASNQTEADAASVREARSEERKEVEEMERRGTLTPESRKQGITSHLSESETAYMYRSEDDRGTDESENKEPSKQQ